MAISWRLFFLLLTFFTTTASSSLAQDRGAFSDSESLDSEALTVEDLFPSKKSLEDSNTEFGLIFYGAIAHAFETLSEINEASVLASNSDTKVEKDDGEVESSDDGTVVTVTICKPALGVTVCVTITHNRETKETTITIDGLLFHNGTYKVVCSSDTTCEVVHFGGLFDGRKKCTMEVITNELGYTVTRARCGSIIVDVDTNQSGSTCIDVTRRWSSPGTAACITPGDSETGDDILLDIFPYILPYNHPYLPDPTPPEIETPEDPAVESPEIESPEVESPEVESPEHGFYPYNHLIPIEY